MSERPEVVIDTEIVRLYGLLHEAQVDVEVKERRVRYTSEAREVKVNPEESGLYARRDYYLFSGDERFKYSIDLVRQWTSERKFVKVLSEGRLYEGVQSKVEERLVEYDTCLDEFRKILGELKEVQKKYTGWSRFYLVVGGHIHNSMDCSTCNNGKNYTQFCWLPNLSGLSESDAVESQGAILCTVCFPTAPVEYTNGISRDEQERLAERCPRSGTAPLENEFRGRSYIKCDCGQFPPVTKAGVIKAHKPPKSKK